MGNKSFLLITLFTIFFGVPTLFYLCYNKNYNVPPSQYKLDNNITLSEKLRDSSPSSVIKIAFISDSHENSKIFTILKSSLEVNNVDFIIHAGDLTNFGTVSSLQKSKQDLDSLGIKYFTLPGDHDIAESGSVSNYSKFFPITNVIELKDLKILFIHNYFNFTLLPEADLSFLIDNIPSSDIIVAAQPIFVPDDNIFYNKYMGSNNAFETVSPSQLNTLNKYNAQRLKILETLRDSKNNKIIISGDHHRSSFYSDPINSLIKYHNLGSLSETITFGKTVLKQTSLQSNRYSILEFYIDDLSNEFKIKEIELK